MFETSKREPDDKENAEQNPPWPHGQGAIQQSRALYPMNKLRTMNKRTLSKKPWSRESLSMAYRSSSAPNPFRRKGEDEFSYRDEIHRLQKIQRSSARVFGHPGDESQCSLPRQVSLDRALETYPDSTNSFLGPHQI